MILPPGEYKGKGNEDKRQEIFEITPLVEES
jgi:hypothetical protein